MERKLKQIIAVCAFAVPIGIGLTAFGINYTKKPILDTETKILVENILESGKLYPIAKETVCFPKEEKSTITGCYRLMDLNKTGKYNSLVSFRDNSYDSTGLSALTKLEFPVNVYSTLNESQIKKGIFTSVNYKQVKPEVITLATDAASRNSYLESLLSNIK